MQEQKFKIGQSKIKVFSFFEEATKENFVGGVTNKIKSQNLDIWRDEKVLKNFLLYKLTNKLSRVIDFDECVDVIKSTLEKVDEYLEDELLVYIFPTDSDFVKDKMLGSSGYCIHKNIIYVDIHPLANWQEALPDTIIHELAHAVSDYYDMFSLSIGKGFIFDGLAEQFREFILGEDKIGLTKTIDQEKALQLFEELKNKLDDNSFQTYGEVFFGSGKYPNWTGYAIGYNIIKKYLDENPNVDWNELLRKDPAEILNLIKDQFA